MNPKHIHTPVSTRVRCPVCHEAVYSKAGIHPQCAVRQSDPPKPRSKGKDAVDSAGLPLDVADPLIAEVLVPPILD